MREEPISLVSYDPNWPRMFEEERNRLKKLLAPWLRGPIEHIGSTAIPELIAKPVIDIMAGVADLASSVGAITAVAELDYQYFPYRPEVMHWFCKPSPERRTHHLHLVPVVSPLWADRLLFRDFLRDTPGVAASYAALKNTLATKNRLDREAYTDAKGDFVRAVLREAKETNPAAH
jgi:GrpB-like predicted nucleotidyltransferase (UPF0157 family)